MFDRIRKTISGEHLASGQENILYKSLFDPLCQERSRLSFRKFCVKDEGQKETTKWPRIIQKNSNRA